MRAALLLLTLGCAHAQATLVDVPGVKAIVFLHSTRDLGWPAEKVQEALSLVEIHWADSPWTGPDGKTWAGKTDGHVITSVQDSRVFCHELTHLVGAYLGKPDPDHLDKVRWGFCL